MTDTELKHLDRFLGFSQDTSLQKKVKNLVIIPEAFRELLAYFDVKVASLMLRKFILRF